MSKPKPEMRRDREFLLYYAGVMLREARARRGTGFSHFLLDCAARARREAGAVHEPKQMDLFA